MNKSVSNKIKNINYILTVLVVILHCNCMVYADQTVESFDLLNMLNKIVSIFCDLAVPTFFAISAFLFFQNYEKKLYKNKLKSRFKTLVIPYLFWSVLFLIYAYVVSRFPSINGMNNSGMYPTYYNLMTIFEHIFIDSFDGPLWYVQALFIIVLLSPIIYLLINKFEKKSLIIVPIFVAIILIFKVSYSTFLYWIPLYYAVAYLTIKYKDKIINYDIKLNKIIIYGMFLFLLILTSCVNISILNFIYKMYAPIVIYTFCSNKFLEQEPKWFMKNAFLIYCTHFVINVIIKRLIILLIGTNPIIMLILRFITCILTIVVIDVLALFMRKICPKFLSVISGGR